MSRHVLITCAIMLAITGPAFADCNQEIQSLDEAVTMIAGEAIPPDLAPI